MYHVSLKRLSKKERRFVPRIPPTAGNEDLTIPRICVSPTINGCIQAIISCHIHEALDQCRRGHQQEVYVYVYTPSEVVPEAAIVETNELHEKKLVFDALETEEMWITQPVTMKLDHVLRVTNVEESFEWLDYADFGFDGFPYQVELEKVDEESLFSREAVIN